MTGVERQVASERRPQDAGVLVGQGHDRFLPAHTRWFSRSTAEAKKRIKAREQMRKGSKPEIEAEPF